MKTNKLDISFEFFPPKTAEGFHNLLNTALDLSALSPKFFSVTFGAGGSTREGTLQTVTMLQEKTAIPIAPHLACIGSTRDELSQILTHYKSLGVDRIVALRGDLPSGMGNSGDLKYASDLVTLIRKLHDDHFHIEVAAYPEFHPQTNNAYDEIKNFKNKVEAGADSAITQYFFNADAYFYYRDQCAKEGIFIPIVPGIMPITQFAKLVRFSDMCGAEIPQWILKRLETYGDDHESIKLFGVEVIHRLCDQLVTGGAPGLHFYTLNQSEASMSIVPPLKSAHLASTESKDRII